MVEVLGYNTYETPRFRNQVRFELVSWIGRHLLRGRSRVRPTVTPVLLDLGTGANFTDNWIHVDFYRLPPLRFWSKWPALRRPDVETDFRFPLDCASDSIDGVYSGHTLEHLYPREAIAFLREGFRVLKPGSWLRINVPDLERYVAFYTGTKTLPGFDSFRSGAEAISFITQCNGHRSTWDERLLGDVLRSVGFQGVLRVEFGKQGRDPRLIKEEPVREWETLVMEAQKPPVSGI